MTHQKIDTYKNLLLIIALLLFPTIALANGGLEKINGFIEHVLTVLRGISVSTVTIAIMWAGYKFIFQHANFMEVGKIVIGGLFIGSAAEVARYMLS